MRKLSEERTARWQEIMSKRYGRPLTQEELDYTYNELMEYALVCLDLVEDEKRVKNRQSSNKVLVEKHQQNVLC